MPIKFSELPSKGIAETSKVIGLYVDNTSNTGVSNCIINTSDFAKQTTLTNVDESAVHKSGAETITGSKTFNSYVIFNGNNTFNGYNRFVNQDLAMKSEALDRTDATQEGYLHFAFKDKNDVEMAHVKTSLKNKNVTLDLSVVNAVDPIGYKGLSVIYNSSTDTVTTQAQTPAAGNNSKQIATTEWCYDPTLSTNLVHRSGNETIAGNKTFTNNVTVNGTLSAPTKGVTTNNTNVATTEFSQSLLRKVFGKTRPTFHTLFSNDSGLGTGDITLSGEFTNYDMILFILGNDTTGNSLCYKIYPTWVLDYLLSYATNYIQVAYSSGSYWCIYCYNKGSSKTFFKKQDENSKMYKIIGLNMDGS